MLTGHDYYLVLDPAVHSGVSHASNPAMYTMRETD